MGIDWQIDRLTPCTYCGLVADSIDHIPPQCMRVVLRDLGEYIGPWKEVPACRWCNSTLGSLALLTIRERRAHIKKALRKKFKSVLSIPTWREENLAELSPGLRAYVIEGIELSRLIRARLAWEGSGVSIHRQAEVHDRVSGGQPDAFPGYSHSAFMVTKTRDINVDEFGCLAVDDKAVTKR